MGSAYSRYYPEPVCTTPKADLPPQQSINFDPRSPSTDINRTPIVYPPPNPLEDPRSPSVGIDRTPITFNYNQQAKEDPAVAKTKILSSSPLAEKKILPLCFDDCDDSHIEEESDESYLSITSDVDPNDDSTQLLPPETKLEKDPIPMEKPEVVETKPIEFVENKVQVASAKKPEPVVAAKVSTVPKETKIKLPSNHKTAEPTVVSATEKKKVRAIPVAIKKTIGLSFGCKTINNGTRSPLQSRNVDHCSYSPNGRAQQGKNSLTSKVINSHMEYSGIYRSVRDKENMTIKWAN